MILYDKKGREIHEYDVLKIFHFIGQRNKKHYMYKHVTTLNNKLYAKHLSKLSEGESDGYFLKYQADESGRLDDTEIVQGINLEDRKKY